MVWKWVIPRDSPVLYYAPPGEVRTTFLTLLAGLVESTQFDYKSTVYGGNSNRLVSFQFQ